jgi:hypothetical protein
MTRLSSNDILTKLEINDSKFRSSKTHHFEWGGKNVNYFYKIDSPKLSWSCDFWNRAILPELKKKNDIYCQLYRKSQDNREPCATCGAIDRKDFRPACERDSRDRYAAGCSALRQYLYFCTSKASKLITEVDSSGIPLLN